ncbi:MAG: hypothetical protein EB005_06350, partial [Actinobacteria bacterium]|nr:hypothetical protein [Actinomycetota bacterium]
MNAVLRRREWATMSPGERNTFAQRRLSDIISAPLLEEIAALIGDVRSRGDDAVCDATRRFDGVSLMPDQLRVSAEEIQAARVDQTLQTALTDAIDHVRRFNEALRTRLGDWSIEIEPGARVGEKMSPIASAGLFVPGG